METNRRLRVLFVHPRMTQTEFGQLEAAIRRHLSGSGRVDFGMEHAPDASKAVSMLSPRHHLLVASSDLNNHDAVLKAQNKTALDFLAHHGTGPNATVNAVHLDFGKSRKKRRGVATINARKNERRLLLPAKQGQEPELTRTGKALANAIKRAHEKLDS